MSESPKFPPSLSKIFLCSQPCSKLGYILCVHKVHNVYLLTKIGKRGHVYLLHIMCIYWQKLTKRGKSPPLALIFSNSLNIIFRKDLWLHAATLYKGKQCCDSGVKNSLSVIVMHDIRERTEVGQLTSQFALINKKRKYFQLESRLFRN